MSYSDDAKPEDDAPAAAASNGENEQKQPAKEASSSTVPLSLSSMAHIMCLPRSDKNEGVLEGLLSVVHHTLSQASSHASIPIEASSWKLEKQTPSTSQFKDLPYSYIKTSYLYSGKELPKIPDNPDDWASACDANVRGRISIYYASAQEDITPDDDEDMQQACMTKAVVEYRSPPSKGSAHARKQEELSLTSFGNGSVDDNVKLGALSSLHDISGKYVLKITSVRNKTYVYDVSDTASGIASVTVTNEDSNHGPPLTRLEFTLDPNTKDEDNRNLRPMSFPTSQLEEHFLVWDNPASAMALPSEQTLLLDDSKRGIYINGRLLQKHELSPTLFGFNLEGVPAWHGRIQDYEMVKQAYATLWQEVMIDARLVHLNIASTLLERLMNGIDNEDDDEDDTSAECLESQLMASPVYDPVGICAKALATRFAQEFGKSAVPCLAHEVEWFQTRAAHKTPVVVPQRVINVLRRGGYFDLQRDTNEMWFSENVRPPSDGKEREDVEEACTMLRAAGCEEDPKIMFVKLNVAEPVKHKYMCRYNDALVQYHVNDAVWAMEKPAAAIAMYVAQEFPDGHVLLKLMSK